MKKRLALIALALAVCTAPGMTAFAENLPEEDVISDVDEEEIYLDDYYDYYDDSEMEPVVSDNMTEFEMDNPYGGDPFTVMIWDGVELNESTDQDDMPVIFSDANNIMLTYKVYESSEDSADYLKADIEQRTKLNLGYASIELTEAKKNENQVWARLSYSGKGMSNYDDLVLIRKLDDKTVLELTAKFANGLDIYGVDYTPDEASMKLLYDALQLNEGEDIGLTAEDVVPEVKIYEYTINDETVGEKTIHVFEEEPYVMTASDYDYDYDDLGEDDWSDVDSVPEDFEVESIPESDLGELGLSMAETESVSEDFMDLIDLDETDSFAEDGYDEMYDDDMYEEDDSFVAYCTTQAKGVFANIEVYASEDPDVSETLIEQYIENLSYFGAKELTRSEAASENGVTWINMQFGNEEEDESYQGLRMVYAVIADENSYTTLELFAPDDGNEEVLNEFLAAYGVKLNETTIEVEQMTFDYDAIEPRDDEMDADSFAENVDSVSDSVEETAAVG